MKKKLTLEEVVQKKADRMKKTHIFFKNKEVKNNDKK